MLKKTSRIDTKTVNSLFKQKWDFRFFGEYTALLIFKGDVSKCGIIFKKTDTKNAIERNYLRRVIYDLYSKYLSADKGTFLFRIDNKKKEPLDFAKIEKDFIYYKKCLEK